MNKIKDIIKEALDKGKITTISVNKYYNSTTYTFTVEDEPALSYTTSAGTVNLPGGRITTGGTITVGNNVQIKGNADTQTSSNS